LWALKSHRDKVLKQFSLDEDSPANKREEFDHSYYQGLLVEIGNLKGFQTFVPYQDKNKVYLSNPFSKVQIKWFIVYYNESLPSLTS